MIRLKLGPLALVFTLLVLVAIGGSSSAQPPASTAGPNTWIDEPLDGSVVFPGRVSVLVHATDAESVTRIAAEVDGIEVATSSGVSGTLAHVGFEVDIAEPGIYELVARSDGAGGTSSSDPVFVTVMEHPLEETPTAIPTSGPTSTVVAATSTPGATAAPAAPTSTAVPTPTTTPTSTPTPTPTPSPTETPMPTSTAAPTETAVPAPTTTAVPVPTATVAPTPAPTVTPTPTPTVVCAFAAPVPTLPANGASTPLTEVGLSWTYSGCLAPTGFDVEVSTGPGFFEPFESGRTAIEAWRTPPLPCGTYYWRVRATDRQAEGPWSQTSSFTISFRGCP